MVRPIQGMLDLGRILDGAERIAELAKGLNALKVTFEGENMGNISEAQMRNRYDAFFHFLVATGVANTKPEYKIEFFYPTGMYTVFIDESWIEELLLPHRVLFKGSPLMIKRRT